MSSYSRPSPNAVIHDWLSRTEVGRQAERHASSSTKKRTGRVKNHQHRPRNVENDLLLPGSVYRKTESRNGDRALREAENLHLPASVEHDTRHHDQPPGIPTTFRNLQSNQKQVRAKEDFAIPAVKRKRSLSSPSLNLRPRDRRRSVAEADDRERLICPKLAGHATESHRSLAKSSHHLPRSSTPAPNSFKTVAKPYERKSRHKTREDHYTVKDASKVTKPITDEGESLVRKKGKRKRREKSGSALMHDFTARNVAFSRLTLRSAPAVGIFSKGRASSPVKRMGLPDLAFSEVSFLKSRRDKPETLERSLRRRKGGSAVDDSEISRYFTSTKNSLPHRPGPELELSASSEQRCQGRRGVYPQGRCSTKNTPLLPLLELPETPFLGFGSSGPMSSPTKLHHPSKAPHSTNQSPHHPTSPTRSTTYYTWSRSGVSSQGSLPSDSAGKTSPRSGLNSECQPHRALAGHAHAVRHQDIYMEHPPDHDDEPRQSEAKASGAEDQARILNAGYRPGQAPQAISIHARSKEPSDQNGKDSNGNSPGDSRDQGFLANSSTPAHKTLVAGSNVPFVSSYSRRENTTSLKSFDAALNRPTQQSAETPSCRITKIHHETAVHPDAENKNLKVQAAGRGALPGYEIHDNSVIAANPTSTIELAYSPSASISQTPQILTNQARTSLTPSSSTAWLSRSPRPYDYRAHRVPVSRVPMSRTCVMGRSEMPAKNAWHAYDNMYERQMRRNNVLSGSVGNVRGWTPLETPSLEESIPPDGHFTRPCHALDPYRRCERVGFQPPEEHNSGSSKSWNEYSENLRGATYRYINSPASNDLVANFSEEGGPHVYEEYSHDGRYDVNGDPRLVLGQKCPLQYCFDALGKSRDLARQDYPSYEPNLEDNPLPWSQHGPSHIARSRHGFIESSNGLRPDQDEEGHLAGFWKPNLLY